jgi:hypothetical protein
MEAIYYHFITNPAATTIGGTGATTYQPDF